MAGTVQSVAPQGGIATGESEVASGSRWQLSAKEAVLAWSSLAVLAALAYMPHIRHGGFYLDDWSDAAATFHPPGGPGLGHVLSYFADLFPYRPALIIYVPLKYFVFGANTAAQLAWAVCLGVIIAALLYGLLRLFAVPWYHAWLISALTIVYPLFDSVRLWEAASLPSVAIVFAMTGLWLALIGLERRSWLFHGCAAALYLVSILTYEITLPFIAAVGVLYVLRAGWRTARSRWTIDLVVVIAAGLWNGLHTNRTVAGVSGDLRHLKEIILGGGTILGRTLIPIGAQSHTIAVLVILAAVLAAGLAVFLVTPAERGEARWGLREWLLLTAAGLVVATLGWIMFIPADPYYTPSVYGFTNRVNALAGFGLVIAAYATLGVGVASIGRLVPLFRKWTAPVTVLLGLLLGVAYVHTLERHSDIWVTAFRAEETAIGQMRSQFPTLPHETTVFTSNYPAYETLGVPIFAATWDLNGMVKMRYNDGTLSAFPVIYGLELVCRVSGVGIRSVDGTEAPPVTTPYGKARLLNLQTGAHSRPRNRRECQSVVSRYVPGPLYLMTAY